MFIVIRRLPICLTQEHEIPCPMSHPIEGKAVAMRWMTERGMQAECKVISEALFKHQTPIKNLNAWITPWKCLENVRPKLVRVK